MGWIRWMLFYRRCDCPTGLCYPMGREGVAEKR
jgi:hypothetical protein